MCEHLPVIVDDLRLAALADELGDLDVVREAVQTFLSELPGRLAAIRIALDNGDAGAARDLAHALGSPAAMLGAASLRQATKQLENAVRSDPGADLDALVADIESVSALTAVELRNYLQAPLPA